MKKLKLSGKKGKGLYALVDNKDYDFLMQWKWYPHFTRGKIYAIRNIKHKEPTSPSQMHRLLLNLKVNEFMQGDHKDGNGLNNQRHNIRKCTFQNNMKNMKPRKNKYGSKYVGVSWQKRIKKWMARITFNSKRIFLGYFEKKIDAGRAVNLANKFYNKEFGYINKINNPFKKVKSTRNTINRGVTYRFNKNKYEANFRYKHKTYYAGSYKTEQEAALAYNIKAIEIIGNKAILNIIKNK